MGSIINQDESTSWIKYPKPNEIYSHYKGGIYKILSLGKDSKDETVVIYRSLLYGSYHTRPLKEWYDKVPVKEIQDGDQALVYRYSLIR